MRLNLHDFSGHPFQVQLSRELAARGHEVLHTYCAEYVTGHGRLEVTSDDPTSLRIEPLACGRPLNKYSPVGRTRFEVAYARAWRQLLEREAFDVTISCNVPLFALARMQPYFRRRRLPWIFWHQDIYSLGIADEAARLLPRPASRAIDAAVRRLERDQVRAAHGVVAITPAMLEQYADWGLTDVQAELIPNWAPLSDITPGRRDNAWAARQGLPAGSVRLLYAGTLGRKHNPMLLVEVLDAVRAQRIDAHLTVISEGVGADEITAATAGRDDVLVLGYQPAEVLPDVLASADVVLAVLEPDAARFSVPSKVHSYLSAGRAIAGLMPADNPAAQDIRGAGGFVGDPSSDGAALAGKWIAAAGAAELADIGRAARSLAEARFDIAAIADRFEAMLFRAAGHRPLVAAQ